MDGITKVNGSIPNTPFQVNDLASRKVAQTKGDSFEKIRTKQTPSQNSSVAPSQTFAVTSLESLFFNDLDEKKKRERQIKYGFDLLDEMEQLHLELLSETVPPNIIQSLSNFLENNNEFSLDPRLSEILKEIKIRIAVELAKLGIR